MEDLIKELNPSEQRKIHEIPSDELDSLFCKFFMTAKKTDKSSIEKLGDLYQPDSLTSFFHGWQRVLQSRGSKLNLKLDKEFENCRQVLPTRRKISTKKGLGNKPCATRALSPYEVDHGLFWNLFPT